MKATKPVSTSVILETRVTDKKGLHPVKLRVTFHSSGQGSSKRKYYVLNDIKGGSLHLSSDNFDRATKDREPQIPTGLKKDAISKDRQKDLRIHLAGIEQKAIDAIDKLPLFTFDAFERLYFGAQEDISDIFVHLTNKAKSLRDEGRISTAILRECTIKSLELFHDSKKLRFDQIDTAFLNKYDAWMVKRGNSLTTVGMYTRCLRAAFNEAKQTGTAYPFGKGGYQVPTGAGVKKALRQEDVVRIANYKAIPGTAEEHYRDLWLFSFLCNGINVKDILRLQYKNIDGDVIRLIRAKTQRENRSRTRLIEIVVTKQVGKIIDRWGVKPGLPDSFIFGFLTPDMTPQQEYDKIQDVVKRVNKAMKSISDELKLVVKATSYTARHSFATVLKRSGASMEFISESLGHTNLQTTENYLANFEIGEKRKWAEKLLQDETKDVNKI